jgi:peptidylprolyl isomerase
MTNTVTTTTTVTLHYSGTLNDGTTFDSSYEREEPITVTLGEGKLLPAFEEQLVGVSPGDTKEFTLSAADAYGDRNPEAVTDLDRTIFPAEMNLTEGMTVPLSNQNGDSLMAVLTEIKETTVTADFNHPMAGKELTFKVEILEVSDEGTTE